MEDSSILILGSNGQLGKALKQKYPRAKALDSNELDISSDQAIDNFDFRPYKVIINAAAYTNVDGAESKEGRVAAWKVNAQALSLLAKKIFSLNITLVHISTDYVFDGTIANHKEDEPLSPLGVYGQSKAAGDLVVNTLSKFYTVRTAWVIGDGKNFVRIMLELAKRGINPTVVSDVIGRPTFTTELVRAIDHLLKTNAKFGTYNITNGGDPVSWADLTKAIYKEAGLNNTVTDTTNEEYYSDKPGAAPRPINSVLDLAKIKLTGFNLTDWREDLTKYLKEEEKQ